MSRSATELMLGSSKNDTNLQPHLVHTHDVHLDTDYTQWLVELKSRYRSAQIKAAVKVNAEKLLFNWQLGRDLVLKRAEERWGAGVVEQVSLDLQAEFPGDKGFSARNLWDMKRWYLYYSTEGATTKLRQFVAEIPAVKMHQLGAEKLQQPVADFPAPFAFIPWGHHIKIMRHSQSIDEAIYYIRRTIADGWNRQTLENSLNADLYHTHSRAITNFHSQLPEVQSRLAQEIIKENYDLSFISLREDFDEIELEDALERNITQFLLELGNGFAFIGRQKEILISGVTRRIDLLFYHIRLRCYVVVELKAKRFKPEFASKLNFYVNAVNHCVKLPEDNPTLGLLVCTGFDKTEVALSFEGIHTPLGVATYNGIRVSDVLPSEELLRQRVRQLETELRLSRKLIHNMTTTDAQTTEE